jgi:hypothetical protein
MRENRLSGLMRGGKQAVIGPSGLSIRRFLPTLHTFCPVCGVDWRHVSKSSGSLSLDPQGQ